MNRSGFIQSLGLSTVGLILPKTANSGSIGLFTQPIKIYDNYIRGTYYYTMSSVFPELKVGDALKLIRIADHQQDRFAIEIFWNETHKLGYIAAYENIVLANLLDAGLPTEALITAINHENEVAIGIWAHLLVSGNSEAELAQRRADDAEDEYRSYRNSII